MEHTIYKILVDVNYFIGYGDVKMEFLKIVVVKIFLKIVCLSQIAMY